MATSSSASSWSAHCDYEVAKEVVIQKILAGKLPEVTEAVIFGVAAELTRFRVDGGKAVA